MEQQFTDQVALVTGGSRGIGRAICIELARGGVTVLINYSSNIAAAEETKSAVESNGGKAELLPFNVGISSEVDSAFDKIKSSYGRLDILVNNAGIARDGLLARVKDEDWQSTIDTNLAGAFYCARAAARLMMKARYGRIINLSSIVGQSGNPGQSAYSASKAGLIGLTKSLAKELASRSITVNAIAPGFIETEMTEGISGDSKQVYLKSIPLNRFGSSEEVAKLACFLSGQDSAYITGQVIGINGGLYCS